MIALRWPAYPHAPRGFANRWRLLARTLHAATPRPAPAHATQPAVAAPASSDAIAGDDFERFLREHERPILNYLWRMTGDEQAAFDLAQDVFLRAWQRFATIRS